LAATGQALLLKYYQEKKELKKFNRQKIEEIYYLTDKAFDKIIRLPQNLLNNEKKVSYEFDDTASKLSMLIQFYVPFIEPDYKEYIDCYVDIGNYITNSVMKMKKNDNSEFEQKLKNYASKHQDFKMKIRTEAIKFI